MRSLRGAAARPGTAAFAAVLAAVAVLLNCTACSSAGTAVKSTPHVLLTSGTYNNVWWGVWAWTEGNSLCMAMAGQGGPGAASPGAQDASGGQCGFANYPNEPSYFDSGPGPSGSSFSLGPLPASATQVRVASGEILPTQAFPPGDGLPGARYWVEIIPASGVPAADGTVLKTPQPLNAAGQPVAFKAF
jgi:hypothetical protein